MSIHFQIQIGINQNQNEINHFKIGIISNQI